MKNKRTILFCVVILLAGAIYFAVRAQQKNDTRSANFSGEWKSKESISIGGNILCTYAEGDRMRSNTMKIAQQADFLTIEVPKPSSGAVLAASQEKLTFDDKESQINYNRESGKKFTAKLSADGKTMTVNSIVHLMVPKPYHVDVKEQLVVYVTEVWKLSDDGESISVQTNAKSNSDSQMRSWNTIFDRMD
jgi:hypothetical protein